MWLVEQWRQDVFVCKSENWNVPLYTVVVAREKAAGGDFAGYCVDFAISPPLPVNPHGSLMKGALHGRRIRMRDGPEDVTSFLRVAALCVQEQVHPQPRMVACEMAGTKMQEPLPTPQKVGLHLEMHLQMWAGTRAWGTGVAVVIKRDELADWECISNQSCLKLPSRSQRSGHPAMGMGVRAVESWSARSNAARHRGTRHRPIHFYRSSRIPFHGRPVSCCTHGHGLLFHQTANAAGFLLDHR